MRARCGLGFGLRLHHLFLGLPEVQVAGGRQEGAAAGDSAPLPGALESLEVEGHATRGIGFLMGARGGFWRSMQY